MALIGTIALNMTVDTTSLKKGLASGAKSLRKVASDTLHLWKNIGSGVTGAMGMAIGGVRGLVGALASLPGVIAGGAIGALFLSAGRGAMDLFEQVSRAKIIFGDFSDTVIGMSDRMAVAFGISKREFIAGASSFADIFRSAKFSEKDVAALSAHFNQLALDMSSFYDIPIAAALEKLHSGLAGEVEPLRQLGMAVYMETVNEYAYAKGIAKRGEMLTESQKIQARAALIDQKSVKAHGDLARTANSAANQTRSLMGRFENLKESIGTSLVAFLLPAMQDINVGLHAIQMAWDSSRYAADQATRDQIAGAGKQAANVGYVQRIIMYAADAWQSFKLKAFDALLGLNKLLIDTMQNMRKTIYVLAPLIGGIKGVRAYEQTIRDLQDQRRSMIKGRDAMAAEPLPSAGIADLFQKAREDIEKKRTELGGMPRLNPMDLKPQVPEVVKTSEPKFASAAVAGSKEAANAVLQSRFGAGGESRSPENQTAKNTAETVALLRKMVGGSREPVEIKGLTRAQQAGAGFLGAFF